MEILSYNCSPSCYVVNIRLNSVKRSSNSFQTKLPSSRELNSYCTGINSRSGFSGSSGQFLSRNLDNGKDSSSLNSLVGFKNSNSKIFSANSDGYVIGGRDDAKSVSGDGDSISKVLIPGLPDESNGGESSAPISSCFWEWKPKFNVHYEKAGCEKVNSPTILFLPGFGVGSFHYEKQLKDLGRDYRVWAVDFLGQGMSLPREDPTLWSKGGAKTRMKNSVWGFGDETEPWANELAYSMELWKDQVCYFVEEVIREPVYIVGNSLGGFVAVYFAACFPHLVKGVTLLNATPFWGFLPNPVRSPRLAKAFPWSGTFPLPEKVRKLIEFVWLKISDPESIAEILKQVYADHSTDVDKVFSRIVETTRHPAAAASFASIMFSPQAKLSFGEAISRCKNNGVPICLMYGKEDPWVRPVWGRNVKKQLPEAPYYEISPAGHCPHDEVPEVVNYLLRGWIKNLESRGSVALPLLDDTESEQYTTTIAKDLEFVRQGSKKSVKAPESRMRQLIRTFRSVKNLKPNSSKTSSSSSSSTTSRTSRSEAKSASDPKPKPKLRSWCVYLILSTKTPIKTYVGVTTDFCRRLKQHNGELKGGAKASRSGRPWILACIIRGFYNRSEACEFETKWKSLSRKLPRKRKNENMMEQMNDASLSLLQHRQAALERMKTSFDCSNLAIDWQLDPC